MPRAGVFAFSEMVNHIVALYLKYCGTTSNKWEKKTHTNYYLVKFDWRYRLSHSESIDMN